MKKLAMFLTLITPLAAEAQMASMSTLQDLPSVAVSVRAITPDGKTFGVKEEALTRVLTDTLTAAGVKVAPADAGVDVSELPSVEITAVVSRLNGQGHIYTLRIALRELVELKRETRSLVELGAITWEKETQGYTSSPDRIVASATTLAERFATEWRQAN
jgi:hypothetical protein